MESIEDSFTTLFWERLDSFLQSPEMEIYQSLQALKATFRIFEGNYYELNKWLEMLKNSENASVFSPSLSVYSSNSSDEEALEILLDKTLRLLHNFLASAFSLVDHTRNIVEKLYSSTEFEHEYKQKLQQDVKDSLICKFIKVLRHYTLHYKLPILSLQITSGENLNFTMRLDVESLRQYKKWDGANAYLENLDDDLCVLTLVDEYYESIKKFYTWLNERQASIHQADLERFQTMKEELLA